MQWNLYSTRGFFHNTFHNTSCFYSLICSGEESADLRKLVAIFSAMVAVIPKVKSILKCKITPNLEIKKIFKPCAVGHYIMYMEI